MKTYMFIPTKLDGEGDEYMEMGAKTISDETNLAKARRLARIILANEKQDYYAVHIFEMTPKDVIQKPFKLDS